MARYTVAQARARLAELLNNAEQGKAVLIERRGVRFRLAVEAVESKAAVRRTLFEYVDPAVLDGNWTWAWDRRGLRFAKRRGRG